MRWHTSGMSTPHLAETYHKDLLTLPAAVERKIDGVRCVAVIRGGDVQLLTRNGNAISAPAVSAELAAFGDCVIDGELFAGGFAGTLSAVAGGDQSGLLLFAFDWLPLAAWDDGACSLTYADRVAVLRSVVTADAQRLRLVPYTVAHTAVDVDAAYAAEVAAGQEGVVVKPLSSMYAFGRDASWLKRKPLCEADLVITGVCAGTGRNANTLGALLCEFEGLPVRVGSGLDDATRKRIWRNPARYIGAVVQVSYMERTASGSLRQPVFMRLRPDKRA